jgi:choline dehydrogenase-like flavoprotein
MIFPSGSTDKVDAHTVGQRKYDVVIVGAGISGAILAYELGRQGKSVLILEAGAGGDRTLGGYQDYVDRFYSAAVKDNQSPYPDNPNVPMPRSTDVHKTPAGITDASGYLVQTGPYGTDTTYTRVMGGTTMHWEAKTPRMLPEDFQMRTLFGHAEDWPLTYQDLEPYYRLAEREIGVSADVSDQTYLGVTFPKGYVYPMRGIPLSYLDRMVDKGISGTKVTLDARDYPLRVRAFPQGRNAIPNLAYDGGKGYVPVSAVSTEQSVTGERCQGNINCVPLCPVQARYNANKTLSKALQTGNVDLLAQSVASKIHVDSVSGRVSHIEFKTYHDSSPAFTVGSAYGTLFVLSANAIENPRLLLASRLPETNWLIGRNLMDHAYLLSWALMPQVCGTMRGTTCTGGIVELRGGSFRRQQAAFSVDIHNDGWGWAKGSPNSDLVQMVDIENKFGATLRRELADRITRQLLLAFMIEVLPSPSNRVAVDPRYTDALGNMRPVVYFTVPEYTMRGAAYAREFARTVFQRLGANDYTDYNPGDYGYVSHEGQGYSIRGGNHLAGTHVMGTSKAKSVVDLDQRSWEYKNLYLAGGGSLPTIGTANVTLTIAALCFRTARAMAAQLNNGT